MTSRRTPCARTLRLFRLSCASGSGPESLVVAGSNRAVSATRPHAIPMPEATDHPRRTCMLSVRWVELSVERRAIRDDNLRATPGGQVRALARGLEWAEA
jgi:hypothetical protein